MVSSGLLWISIVSAVKLTLATTFEGVVYFSKYVPVGTARYELVTENVGTFLDITIDECTKRCQRMKACDFVNYHFVSHTCFIVRHVDKTIHVTGNHGNGFSLGIKAEWTLEADTKCESCTENEICSETEENGTCSVATCGLPDIPDHAVVTGNMHNVGSLAAVSCKTSALPEPGVRVTTTCMKDGNWSSVNLTCIPETTTTTTTTTTATTTTTEPPEPFTCHADADTFKTVLLSDGSAMSYRISSAKLTFPEATTTCATLGGSLIQITSMTRFYFASALVQCSAFDSHDYWIDATRSNGEFFTSDGQAIPNTGEVWSEISGSGSECARLEGDKGKINDKRCTGSLYYICEN